MPGEETDNTETAVEADQSVPVLEPASGEETDNAETAVEIDQSVPVSESVSGEETDGTETDGINFILESALNESGQKFKIEKAKPYKQLLDGCMVSVTLASLVIMLKAEHMIPCNRIGTIFRELGTYFPCTSSICTWIIKICQIYFRPLFKRLKEELLKAKVIQAHETGLRVINELAARRKTKSFLWQYGTGPDEAVQVVLFQYCPGRGGKYCAEFLKGFLGTLVVDGYSGYNAVEDADRAGCWSHSRRYLIKAAIISSKNDVITNDLAEKGLDFIDRMFDEEEAIQDKKLSKEARRPARQEKIAPIVHELYEWIESLDIESLSSRKLRQAFNYLLNHKDNLMVFLDNPAVPMTNNRAESAFVSISRGRGNWEFAYSPEGAEALALMFTITKTARMNGLNIFQ